MVSSYHGMATACNSLTLLGAFSNWVTGLAQASQVIKLGLSVPQTHTSLLLPPPSARTSEHMNSTWTESNAAVGVQSVHGTALRLIMVNPACHL